MSQTKTRFSVTIFVAFMLPTMTTTVAWAGDASLEVIAIQEGCVPKVISNAHTADLASVWKVDCKGGNKRMIYIECQRACRVRESDERIDTTSGHRE